MGKRGFLIMMFVERASEMEAPGSKQSFYFQLRLCRRCGRSRDRGCRRVLAVKVVNESTSNVDVVGSVSKRNVAAVDDHRDAARLRESFEGLGDVLLQR